MNKDEFKEIRQALKLRGEALAKKLGRPVAEIYSYETGAKSIPDNVAKYLRAIKPKNNIIIDDILCPNPKQP